MSKHNVLLSEFFHRAMVKNVKFKKITLDTGPSILRRFFFPNTVDFDGMTLTCEDGTEGGELSAESMRYWAVVGLRRQLPRGASQNQIMLELE